MLKRVFVFLLIPVLISACSQNNVKEDNSLKSYFDSAGVTGSFGLFDNGQGNFIIYNLPRFRDSAYLPAATFDIPLSLIGIQTGVVKDDSALITLDSTDITKPGCDRNLTLKQAFQHSCESGFRQLAGRIGKDTLKKWIDSLSYGNKNIDGPVDSFWMNGHLTLSSDEQLGLVKKLYFDQLRFFRRTQGIVRQMMLMESNANYKLSYKTGTGVKKDEHSINWLIGWVEENTHVYFFVLNIETATPAPPANDVQIGILKGILKKLGFLEGKR
ncbi:penicillin-binding transpeptidase domain-containing protein [Flavitalea flava]